MTARLSLLALILVGCGGGASTAAAEAPPSHTPPAVPTAGSGYAIGGASAASGGSSEAGAAKAGAGAANADIDPESAGGAAPSGELGLGDAPNGGAPHRASFDWQLPPGFPPPALPAGKHMSRECVELGRYLFYDRRLSGNQTQSCAECHQQARAFTDGRATALGSTGEAHPRAAPSIANVAYYSVLTWENPLMATLEQQALVPMFGDNPIELGLTKVEPLLARLRAVPEYTELFLAAFPDKQDAFELPSVTDALACFERSIFSAGSAYDDYVYGGNDAALSDSAKRGLALFFSETADCYHCHGGFNFSDDTRSVLSGQAVVDYHNTGLYNLDALGSYPAPSTGKEAVTGSPADMGAFRAPTLRNVELTAPYMHDGSVATLEDVVHIYNDGGRNVATGPNAGDGRKNPLKDALIRPLGMNEQQLSDLVEFLKSLTDYKLLTDPRYGDPWQ